MGTELTLDLIQSQLKPKQKLTIGQSTLDEIQKLADDPDYGPEFLDTYLDHLNVLKENPKRNHANYLEAVKFFSLVEAGNNLTDAYIKTFPHRFKQRTRNGGGKDIMRGEASRYNNTQLVNEIRKVAGVPVQLIHRHLLHEAILVQADIMRTGKTEFVRQKASETLIRELKPTEDQVLNIQVDDGASSVIDNLRKHTEALAALEHQRVTAGIPLKEIAESRIIDITPVEEDDDAAEG